MMPCTRTSSANSSDLASPRAGTIHALRAPPMEVIEQSCRNEKECEEETICDVDSGSDVTCSSSLTGRSSESIIVARSDELGGAEIRVPTAAEPKPPAAYLGLSASNQ